MEDLTFLMAWRDNLLQMLDLVERKLVERGMLKTRTSELRQQAKQERQEKRLIPRVEGDTMAVAG